MYLMQFFAYEHLPAHLQAVSKPFCDLAKQVNETLPYNYEKTMALRKLLEAKDCAVRALIFKPRKVLVMRTNKETLALHRNKALAMETDGRSLAVLDKVVLDSADALELNSKHVARIAELEAGLASSQTASQHFYHQLMANNEIAAKRIEELEAALAEAKKDGERLDFLERGGWSLIYSPEPEQSLSPVWSVGLATETTVRAAIDAAKEKV